jgi:putative ABC transport system permease protein
LFFIITSILIYTQFRYFTSFEYGFNPKGIINIELQGNDFRRVHDLFGSLQGVSNVSASEYIPGTGRTSGMELNRRDTEEPVGLRYLSANETFAQNLGLSLIAGRNLPEAVDSAGRYILVNEMAVKALGFETPEEIVGQVLVQTWNREMLEVAGVVKDFWLKLPIGGDKLEPAFLRNDPGKFSFANVKINSPDVAATIGLLENKWKSIDPVHPFKYRFFEEELASTHAGIFDVVSIVGFLAFVAITIACLGMLGMATYTVERKRKEVGIRKVLGAETIRIALMLSKEFLTIIAASICIGAPLSWFINNVWLQNFANHADFGLTTVCIGTSILVFLGMLTIGSQTIRVSKSNPVDTLKMD